MSLLLCKIILSVTSMVKEIDKKMESVGKLLFI